MLEHALSETRRVLAAGGALLVAAAAAALLNDRQTERRAQFGLAFRWLLQACGGGKQRRHSECPRSTDRVLQRAVRSVAQ